MQQQYNNQYPPQQPQQPQYQQAPQAPQQPYQQPYQQQPQYQQPYQQPVYQAPKQPMAKDKLFGLLTTILFGTAALFELIAFIGICAKGGASAYGAGFVISTIISILGCIGIAIAPFIRKYTKFIIAASAAGLFLGVYGVSTILISLSVGYLFYALGFACLGILCWLHYVGNQFAKMMWIGFVPAGLIFLGALLNWIIVKYFSMMKFATVYYLFDFLFGIVIIGAAVILGLYLIAIFNEKSAKISIPNPAPRAPQQPQYQPPQAPQAPQYQQPQQPQYQPPQQPPQA